jgi:hypothetical protein
VAQSVPEPGEMLLWALGLAVLMGVAWGRRPVAATERVSRD